MKYPDYKRMEEIAIEEGWPGDWKTHVESLASGMEMEEVFKENKINIEFIQWIANQAEGFGNKKVFADPSILSINILLENSYLESKYNHFDTEVWNKIYYPLLMQRAIEAINKEWSIRDNGFAILQHEKAIVVYFAYHIEKVFDFKDYKTIDQTKEEALKYLWKQEII